MGDEQGLYGKAKAGHPKRPPRLSAFVRRLRRGNWHPVDLLDARHDLSEQCRCYTSGGVTQYLDCPVHYSPPLPGAPNGKP